ncbi:MAG: putative P-loop ATPase [Hydrogenibacillus schlegelii]|uniref:Putative P-loop ATPase n=1 Tax=Hydrogenibacillus schlegelii TaxID=1484 RepID=A0A2T5G5B8_HYDSH|nr:MAG: putative P-loop ATPase [Hydrogenibacillus schlegelii]
MSVKEFFGLNDDDRIGETSSSEYASEGGMPTFDRIPFRVRAGRRPNLNTFVIALRQDDARAAHYGRIVHGGELNRRARPVSMQQDEAYGMSRPDLRPSENSPDLVRVMEIEILGEIRLGEEGQLEVLEPSQLPHTGQPVYELPAYVIPRLLNIPSPERSADEDEEETKRELHPEGLHIGEIESGGKRVHFLLPVRAVARHIAILGKTGVGKSYAAGVLMEELYKKGIPVLSFDVLGDTEQTARDLGGIHVEAGKDDYKVPYALIGLEEFLAFIPNLTADQRELIATAYGNIYDKAMKGLTIGGDLGVPFNDLYNEINEVGRSINSRSTSNAVIRTKAALGRNPLLTEKGGDWVERIAEFPLINVYVGHLGQRDRNLFVGATTRILQRYRRLGRIPPFVLVLDEAHLFLPAGGEVPPSTRVLREMIRTARHDSVGIVLLSQSPASMDKQILLTCNTRILFALDPEDLRVVAGQIGDLPEETVKRIPRMPRGTAVVTSGMDLMRHPVVVRIREREFTKHAAETPNLREAVEKWKREKEEKEREEKRKNL